MRIIVKIGSALLTREDNQLNQNFLRSMVKQLAELHRQKHQIVLVTSGAMAAGRSVIKFKKESKNIPVKQVLAAVGQSLLMNTYVKHFRRFNIPVAQALLTNQDFVTRETFLNTRNIFERLLDLKIIPIVNENDVTSVEEICEDMRAGGNDLFSAKVAGMLDADWLVLLTNVAGLYTADPTQNPKAELIQKIDKITPHLKKIAQGTTSSKSMGGMVTKLQAAEYVTTSGIQTVIADGKISDILLKIINKKPYPGTYFSPAKTGQKEKRKKWMLPQLKKNAWIMIDAGAEKALCQKGSSLLPLGLKNIHGKFSRGDVIAILNPKKQKIAFGLVNYSSTALTKIKGCHSREIPKLLEEAYEPEVIHRDNLVLI